MNTSIPTLSYGLVIFVRALLLLFGLTVPAAAAIVTVDEKGNGFIERKALPSNVGLEPNQNIATLFYTLPFTVLSGDVEIRESMTERSDVISFNGNEMYFFSDMAEPGETGDLADLAPPDRTTDINQLVLRLGAKSVSEVGREGDNMAAYTPGPGDPGYPANPANAPLTYLFVSDGTAVPLAAVKVVPVIGCVVDDRPPDRPQDPHVRPAGRFSNLKLLAALLGKNLIWAQVGILWIPQGFPVLIADPDPPPQGAGQRGDVLLEPENYEDPTNAAARREVEKVKLNCNDKIGRNLAREKIVDVVIRRFVDRNGMPSLLDPMSTLKGVSEKPAPVFPNSLPDKPMVRDPDSFRNFARCTRIGGEANESFVRTLAHENGHALSLQHPAELAAPNRLMGQTRVTAGCSLTMDEGLFAKKAADQLSGAKPKKRCGASLPEPKPRTRIAVAAIGNVAHPEIDIVEAVGMKRADGALGLDMYLSGLVPADSPPLKYIFVADVDNNSTTGGSPSPGFPGTDLLAEITVSSVLGSRSVTASVKRFQGGQFVEVVDSRIRADFGSMLQAFDVDVAGEEFPGRDAATLTFPSDLLPVPLSEGFRVGTFALDLNSSEMDQAPIVIGSITELPEPTFISLKALSGGTNAKIAVTGMGFTPNAKVDVFSGTVNVARGSTDSQGNFMTQFTVPSPTEDTFVQNTEGRLVSPVTAVDESFLADAMIYDPLACDVNTDGKVDRSDINSIFAMRNTPVIDEAFDVDCDMKITVNDARACSLQCIKPQCAP